MAFSESYSLAESKVHSSESYYRNVLWNGSSLVVPYVSLGLRGGDLNTSKDFQFIDRCYVVLESVYSLSLHRHPEFLVPRSARTGIEIFLGGRNLDGDMWVDMDVKCERAYLQVDSSYQFSHSLWVPIPTPNLAQNISTSSAEGLFSYSEAPDFLKEMRAIS